jgi:hypothetical protein
MYHLPPIAYVALFSQLLPICVGIIKKQRSQPGITILFYFLVTTFVADNILIWFFQGHPYHLGLIHVYFLIEYIFTVSIILVWQESRRMRMVFQALLLLYIFFWITAKFTFEPLNQSFSLTASISQVILSLGAGYTLFVVIGNRTQALIHYNRFWVLLSFIIYFAGTLLIIALREILIHYSIETFFFINSIDWILKIFINILFAIAFLCPQTQKK